MRQPCHVILDNRTLYIAQCTTNIIIFLSNQELSTVMRSLGQNPTDAEVQDLINEVDVDGSGALDFQEFCMMIMKKMSESNTDKETQEAFRVFDKDKDGFIPRAELRMILAALPERLSADEIEEMLEAADEDGNEPFD